MAGARLVSRTDTTLHCASAMNDPEPLLDEPAIVSPRRWRWVVLAAFLLAGALIGRAVYNYSRRSPELEQVVAELEASDPRWRLRDIEDDREAVPESENSARVVTSVARLLPPTWSERYKLDTRFLGRPAEVRLAPEEYAELCRALGPVQPALEAAAALPDRPRGRHALVFQRVVISTPLTDQGKVQDVALLMRLVAIRRAREAAPAEALRWCLGAANAGRSIGDEPVGVSQLIRADEVILACRAVEHVLAQGVAADADLKRVQEALLDEDRHDGLRVTTRGERGSMDLLFEVLETGEVTVNTLLGRPPTVQERYLGGLGRRSFAPERALYLRLMNRRLAEVHWPMHQQPGLERAFAADVLKLSGKAPVAEALLSGLTKSGPSFRRKHASVRALAALLACERYRIQKGAWPADLGQLVPALLSAVPRGPSDGKPLCYTRLPDGVRVYSVGEAGEVGFRLWDPNNRGRVEKPK